MATSAGPRRTLPANPSQEYLRKEAKRLAKAEGLRLAAAQRRLAGEYGHGTWAALMRAVEGTAHAEAAEVRPLVEAAARADEDAVRALLAASEPADANGDVETPLMRVCGSDADDARKIMVARLLLEAGGSPRQEDKNGTTALHLAARHGPLALVELLIRNGAFSWQADRRGRTALDYARAGKARERNEIMELLDRPVIRDPQFRAAVRAIHAGDEAALSALLDAHPDLLRRRPVEPDCYPRDYFRDPKLFWFIANNPTLMKSVPDNIAAIGRIMIARGVAQADLDYTLELVMTAGSALGGAKVAELTTLLLESGAKATPKAVLITLAHCLVAPIELLLSRGARLTAAMAAGLGRMAELERLLKRASAERRQEAFGLAVINKQVEAARLCLDAGADVNAFLPVHKHSMPLHQAALHNDVVMLRLLIERGADMEVRDTLWNGTPLGWAVHNRRVEAEAYFREVMEESKGG
ncbi:MAG: ankyrin repeat domain-containing protein [Hyphomicrobiaceae bacterium]